MGDRVKWLNALSRALRQQLRRPFNYLTVVVYLILPRGNPSPKLAITVDPDGHRSTTRRTRTRQTTQAISMTIVYDTGVLIAADRNDRQNWAEHRARLEAGVVPVTTAPIVAQASRTPKQVQLRRFLRGCDVVAFEAAHAHAVGALLAKSATSDIVDAHVAVTAALTSAVVITSDPDGLRTLAAHVRPRITIRTVSSISASAPRSRPAQNRGSTL
jgi:predicted nucleic acid-binding protein